ncbi:hypothetical protein MHYP_G00082650 [Metynnis hypsauchen]
MDKENSGVPIKVWLYSLVLLNQEAAALVREISTSLVSKAEHIVEQLGEVERRCNDLVGSKTVQDFFVLKTRLQTFQGCYSDYRAVFQKALCRVLPDIRGGGKEEQALAEIIAIHNKAPFTANKLNEWLESITTELQILSSYTKGLKDIRVLTSLGQLNAVLFDPEVDVVVCLAFTSLTNEDKFLETLNKFLSSEDFKKLEDVITEEQNPSSQKLWFTSFDISQSMRENLSLFKSFSKANKDNERIQFVIASIPDPSNPGTSIYLYEKGRRTDSRFKPVSKPPPPTQNGMESLKLQESPTGETVSYRVEYRRIDGADAGAKTDQGEKWENRDTPDAQETFMLTGLQLGDLYWVRYRAVSKVGGPNAASARGGLKLNARFAQKQNHLTCLDSLRVQYGGMEWRAASLALRGGIQRGQRKSEPRGSSDRYLVSRGGAEGAPATGARPVSLLSSPRARTSAGRELDDSRLG